MEEITKIYSVYPPGLMRSDENTNSRPVQKCEGIDSMPLAMAYVPWQSWQNVYEKDKGFMRGTIFADLDKPFKGAKR